MREPIERRGGYRPNAGRPRGSRTQAGRRVEAKERLAAILDEHEPAILRRLLAVDDPRVLIEVYRLLLSYADGRPKEQVHVEHGVDLQGFLEQLAIRRAAIPVEREPALLAEVHQTEIAATENRT